MPRGARDRNRGKRATVPVASPLLAITKGAGVLIVSRTQTTSASSKPVRCTIPRAMRRAILAPLVLASVLGLTDNATAGRPHKPPKVTIRATHGCSPYHGMASGAEPVTVHVYEGETTAGPEIAQQTVLVVKHK